MLERTNKVPLCCQHIPALDGIRGVAILMVIVFHLFLMLPHLAAKAPYSLVVASRLGQMGVDLFFVLSGFLITGILYDTKRDEHYLRNFYARRTLRIFPLYYAVLLAATLVTALRPNVDCAVTADGWMWLYAANIPPTFSNSQVAFPHFWSLAVEEQFYLIWPWAVLWLDRRWLLRLCVACLVLTIATRCLLLQVGFSAFYFLPCRMDALAAGGMVALLARGHDGLRRWRPCAWFTGIGVLLVAVPWFAISSGAGSASVQIVKHTLSTILFATFLTVVLTSTEGSSVASVLKWTPLRLTGKYSYALYVFHPLVIDLVGRRYASGGLAVADAGPLRLVEEVAVIVLISFAAAWLSWHAFEKHVLSLKRHFRYSAYPSPTLPRPGRLRDDTAGMDDSCGKERVVTARVDAVK